MIHEAASPVIVNAADQARGHGHGLAHDLARRNVAGDNTLPTSKVKC